MTRKSRLGAWRAAVAAAAVGLCASAAAASTRYIDYLYVEANEGGSSGGHVAIRFQEWTFHFQQRDGFLRLRRDDSPAFVHTYAMLGNRSLRELRIAVSEDTYALLREAFSRRHLAENEHFDRLAHLRRDGAFFDWLAGDAAGEEADLVLPVAGLFYPASAPDPPFGKGRFVIPAKAGIQSFQWYSRSCLDPRRRGDDGVGECKPLLGKAEGELAARAPQLRARIASAHGAAFLDTEITTLRHALRQPPTAVATTTPMLSPDTYPLYAPTPSQEWREHMLRLLGLAVLRDSLSLRPNAYHVPDEEADLTPGERERLRAAAEELSTALIRLPTSSRPDWGLALIVGLGRLEALDASLRLGRLVLLGGDEVDRLPVHPAPGPMRAAFVREIAGDLARVRRDLLTADGFRESDLSVVEVAAARLQAARAAAAHGGLPRASAPLYPDLLIRHANPVRPALSPTEAAAQCAAARVAARDYQDALGRLYGYDLIGRNCVSELFAVIETALTGLPHIQAAAAAGSGALADAIAEESRHRLGGALRAGGNLLFIPWLSAGAVAERYAVVAQRTQPSFRRQQLATLYAQAPAVWAYMREFNTLTSTLYVPAEGDSPFLFFTDDVVLGRPLLGAANVGVACGHAAVGLFTAPFDRGRRLRSALQGMVSSLPELVFVNLRKGSLPFVTRSLPVPPPYQGEGQGEVTDVPQPRYGAESTSGGSTTCTSSTCGANGRNSSSVCSLYSRS